MTHQSTQKLTPILQLPRKTRSRFKPQPKGGLVLGPRDHKLLTDVYLHGLMSRSQIQALYFGSTPRTNARLRQLYDFHYVYRHYLPVGPSLAPFGIQSIYSIGKEAVPLVAAHLDIESRVVSEHYRRHKTPTFIHHTLAITDFYIALRQAIADLNAKSPTGLAIERWLPELLCRHEYEFRSPGGSWRKETFKPDGFVRFALSKGVTQHSATAPYANYFLEVDLGHTSLPQFLSKLEGHHRYLESGLFKQTFGGNDFHTLVITTTTARLNNLRAAVAERGTDLFWFTTFTDIQNAGIMNRIWHRPLHSELTALL